jgi:poly-gamma-glutamate capsule biosynthesis protein CapA/YwtB (metallophosphatase superfamily)
MSPEPARLRLALCGDVMIGRGIDQILPHPGNPAIYVSTRGITDAKAYVQAAVQRHGSIPANRGFAYVWGDVLSIFASFAPDLRMINLETAITTQGEPWPNKLIHFRMNPRNVAALLHADIDFCSLANNHVMDWGYIGLTETMTTLAMANIARAGVGRNLAAASLPAILTVPKKGRVIVLSFTMVSGHTFPEWAAESEKPGVHLIKASSRGVDDVKRAVAGVKGPADVLVASVHAGHNFSHEIESPERDLFRRLIDEAGFDLIHCHSSHHVKAIEVHNGRPILYGTGDLINDYEGLPPKPERAGLCPHLGVIAFADFSLENGACTGLFLCPTRIRRMRVERADSNDTASLGAMLTRESVPFGTRIENRDGFLSVEIG